MSMETADSVAECEGGVQRGQEGEGGRTKRLGGRVCWDWYLPLPYSGGGGQENDFLFGSKTGSLLMNQRLKREKLWRGGGEGTDVCLAASAGEPKSGGGRSINPLLGQSMDVPKYLPPRQNATLFGF